MIKTCVFDAQGNLINIGEWDYAVKLVGRGEFDELGNELMEEVVTNPLPEGAYIEEREVTKDADSGWVLASDYAALRRSAYPAYSPYDILDELLKVITPEPGSKLEQMINERNQVKQQYPKP